MRAEQFAPLDEGTLADWSQFLTWEDRTYFPMEVGLVVEEIRTDYCRMRLPFRPELNQPAGVVHGGAIATLIDTVVVPAIGQAYETTRVYLTIGMNISYLGAVVQEDAIAEGWVEQRGRSIVFCQAEVRTAGGRLAAQGTLTYKVNKPAAA
jgi:uncharacterized protein (TIGR00369 family)